MRIERRENKKKEEKLASPRNSSLKGCCFLYFFLYFFVLFLVLFPTILLAKTGIIEVPLISKIFYHPPSPYYFIEVPLISQKTIQNKIEREISKQVLNFPEKKSLEISLTEREVSGLLRDYFDFLKKKGLEGEDFQILFLEGGEVELFGKIKAFSWKEKNFFPKELIIYLKFFLSFQDSKIKISFHKTKIGSLSIPNFLMNALYNFFFKEKMAFEKFFKEKGILLQEIKVEKEKIIFVLKPSKILP